MKASLDYRKDFLCVLAESGAPDGAFVREWYPVHPAEEAETRGLVGRPVAETDSKEAIYVDEEGAVFQLLNKGETKDALRIGTHALGGALVHRQVAVGDVHAGRA